MSVLYKPCYAACGRTAGVFSCYGCSRHFCVLHATEHRQLLQKEMNENVLLVHGQLLQSLNENTKKLLSILL